jgi:hypothetical protein
VKKKRITEKRRLELIAKRNKKLRRVWLILLVSGFVLTLFGIRIGSILLWSAVGLWLGTIMVDIYVHRRKSKL